MNAANAMSCTAEVGRSFMPMKGRRLTAAAKGDLAVRLLEREAVGGRDQQRETDHGPICQSR